MSLFTFGGGGKTRYPFEVWKELPDQGWVRMGFATDKEAADRLAQIIGGCEVRER